MPWATRGYPGLPGEVDGADAVGWNGMQPLKSEQKLIFIMTSLRSRYNFLSTGTTVTYPVLSWTCNFWLRLPESNDLIIPYHTNHYDPSS